MKNLGLEQAPSELIAHLSCKGWDLKRLFTFENQLDTSWSYGMAPLRPPGSREFCATMNFAPTYFSHC
jgi:hypothetical protein